MDEEIDYYARAIVKIKQRLAEKEQKLAMKVQERTIEFTKKVSVTTDHRIRFNLPEGLKEKLKPKDKVLLNVIFTYYETDKKQDGAQQ